MKKLLTVLAAVMMCAVLFSALAFAEEDASVPQPEGGKKFESCWALAGGLIHVDYEEEGYRVNVEIYNSDEGVGTIWNYNCYYVEDRDALVSVSSEKHGYTYDLDTNTKTEGDSEYDDLDLDNNESVFTIDANGKLIWEDGRGNCGADLEFINIGSFEGRWVNDAEGVCVEINWIGLDDQERFYYDVFLRRSADESYTDFLMTGVYNNETAKLECMGTATTFTKVDGEFVPGEDDGESYDAFFSMTDSGLLFETANGIDLTYEEKFDD